MPITDISFLTPEDIKFRNTFFLIDQSRYDVLDYETVQQKRNEIWRVRNGDLRKLFREFPFDEPLLGQCGLWMHAMVGKHFFPDANHRTAMSLLREILRKNGYELTDWPIGRSQSAVLDSKRARQSTVVNLGNLYEKDELYEIWREYFEEVLELPNSDSEP